MMANDRRQCERALIEQVPHVTCASAARTREPRGQLGRASRMTLMLTAGAVAIATVLPLSIAVRAQPNARMHAQSTPTSTSKPGSQSQVRRMTLPAETAVYRPSKLPGYELTQAQCSTCHSADYVLYQPPSPRAYWQATVDKMVKTFGAPVAPDQIPAIVEYLAATYGPDATASQPAPAAPARR